MNLPRLDNAESYAGLFVADFGQTTAVGYTAEEVTMLAESGKFPAMKVYRIHRVGPEGQMELAGVRPERLTAESGTYFHSRDEQAARRDFAQIKALAEQSPPPCRARLVLVSLAKQEEFAAGLEYLAACESDIGRWLLEHSVQAGEYADGGPDRLSYFRKQAAVLESAELTPPPFRQSRSREEVLASIDRHVQRKP